MALILNIETSSTNCSVALAYNAVVIASKELNDGFSHSENLMIFVVDVMKMAKKKLSELNAIAINGGPGSYTGLRIGVSAAKGLCFGLNIPLMAIDSLSILSKQIIDIVRVENALYMPMIDARRMEIYSALLDYNLKFIEPITAKIINESSFDNYNPNQNIYYFGDGSDKCAEILKNKRQFKQCESIIHSAKCMASLSFEKYKNQQFEDVAYYVPNYLKEFYTNAKNV